MIIIIFDTFIPILQNHMDFVGSHITAQKMKFSIKDFFSKCGQIRSMCVFLRLCNSEDIYLIR